ncbi:MAG: N-acetylglucosamine-6-phosphate deacetylase [Burkholderiales bacterium]|nr:MAG: N-acetylglucosamine-6-phosphate deacetylase [Burkholderiales bacterium]
MLALAPTQLFTDDGMIENATVRIHGGRIVDVTHGIAADARKLDGLLAPGFIDTQVNGGGGALFNDTQTVETLKTIAMAHAQFGVTGFMATLISDERGKAAAAIAAVSDALAAGVEGLLGLHLEGPWLSAPRRGVHPAEFLRELDDADLKLLTKKLPFPLLVTVAPEQVSPQSIRALVKAGVRVSLGHTAAATGLVEQALAAGATGFTHLFNAMPPMEGRNPGPLGVALADRNAWAGMILDGIHVHPTSAKAAFAAKTADRLMLVSDAMATIGSDTPSMSLFGETISVRDNALRTASGTLAGAHLEMSGAVRNAVTLLGASRNEALRMGSLTPATFVGVDHERGRIAKGYRADLVLLDDDMHAKATWIAGRQVH